MLFFGPTKVQNSVGKAIQKILNSFLKLPEDKIWQASYKKMTEVV